MKNAVITAKIYYFEILIFSIVFVILSLLVIRNSDAVIVSLTAIFTFIIIIISLAHKRNKQIDKLKNIFINMRNNTTINPADISLDKNLIELQEEIRAFYLKNRSDIEYLKKLERMRTQFIGNVSHELRTPIFNIQGYLETLLDGALEDEKVNRMFLEKAIKNTINLGHLLNDLIDLSMIESGEMRMSFRYFNLKDFLNSIVEEYKETVEEKGLRLSVGNFNNKIKIFADKNKLHQVFNNLIQNAIKYTDEGEITIIVEEEIKKVNIKIIDTGIGIPPEHLNRIFERFYRIDKARSRDAGGTGLGLAIVKHIIEAHNSQIIVKSEVNKGSEFSFKLEK